MKVKRLTCDCGTRLWAIDEKGRRVYIGVMDSSEYICPRCHKLQEQSRGKVRNPNRGS